MAGGRHAEAHVDPYADAPGDAAVPLRAASPRAARPADPQLREVLARTRPVVHKGEQVLPIVPALDGLLPWSGLRRGATVAVSTVTATAGTSLALALAAGPSQAGSWCAAVGLSSLGLVAAVEAGIDLARFPMVAAPSEVRDWATVVAALLDAFDVVLACPPRRVPATDARRLTARSRERGAVLVVVGGSWEGVDVRLSVRRSTWDGLGQGHGHLCARRVEVVAEGRGAAARPRAVSLWLPDADGRIRRATPSGRRPDLSREQPGRSAGPRSPLHATGRKGVRVAG